MRSWFLFGQFRELGEEVGETRREAREDGLGDLVGGFLVVSVAAAIACRDHRHPLVAVLDQALGEGLARGVSRAVEAGGTARLEEILERAPREFVREFEGVYQPLLLKVGERTLPCECGRGGQPGVGQAKALEALAPTNVGMLWHGRRKIARAGTCGNKTPETAEPFGNESAPLRVGVWSAGRARSAWRNDGVVSIEACLASVRR